MIDVSAHSLELFYHVASHQGVGPASRALGRNAASLRRQMGQLENLVGQVLYERQPFRPTAAGRRLLDHIKPMFEGVGPVLEEIRGQAAPVLRLAASELVHQAYVGDFLALLKRWEPRLRTKLVSGSQSQMHAWLEVGEVDLVVAPLGRALDARFASTPLLSRRLVLLVAAQCPARTPDDIFALRPRPELFVPATSESVVQRWEQELARRGLRWPASTEASSLPALAASAGKANRVCLCLDDSHLVRAGVRVLPLDLAPIDVVATWREPASSLVHLSVQALQARARRLTKTSAFFGAPKSRRKVQAEW